VSEKRNRYDVESREAAGRTVEGTEKPISQVARNLGVKAGTPADWGTSSPAVGPRSSARSIPTHGRDPF